MQTNILEHLQICYAMLLKTIELERSLQRCASTALILYILRYDSADTVILISILRRPGKKLYFFIFNIFNVKYIIFKCLQQQVLF